MSTKLLSLVSKELATKKENDLYFDPYAFEEKFDDSDDESSKALTDTKKVLKAEPLPKKYTEKELERKAAEDERCAGPKWFNFKSQKMTKELEQEMRILKHQSLLNKDRRHFRIRSGVHETSKFFAIGQDIDGSLTQKSDAILNRHKKKNLVDFVLDDAGASSFVASKFDKYKEDLHKRNPKKKKKRRSRAKRRSRH
ncbi:hypothetical protein PCE1_003753 [Barthelona sp. PCE]